MATTDRKNRLLVAEDWRKIYQAFQQADFKSYDFETLRRTMVAYLRENYPDDFNDFVEIPIFLVRNAMIFKKYEYF